MQNAEVMVLRRRCMAFEVTHLFKLLFPEKLCTVLTSILMAIFQVKQSQFREMFRATAPFSYNAAHPYISLEKVGVKPFLDYRIKIKLYLIVHFG